MNRRQFFLSLPVVPAAVKLVVKPEPWYVVAFRKHVEKYIRFGQMYGMGPYRMDRYINNILQETK